MQNTISSARERRRFPRLPIEFDVRFRVVDATTSTREESTGRTLDLARGGLRFRTETTVCEGDVLALHMTIPGTDRVVATLMEVVRAARDGDDGTEVGACFLWSGWHDGDMQRAIADFVDGILADREAPTGAE